MLTDKKRHYFVFSLIIKPFKWHLLAMACNSLIWALSMNIQPYLIKLITDAVTDNRLGAQALMEYVGLLFAAYLSFNTFYLVSMRTYDWVCLQFVPRLKESLGLFLMDRMMKHRHELAQNQFSGNFTNKIIDVLTQIPEIILIISEKLLSYILLLTFALYNLYHVHIQFMIAMLIWVSIFLSISFICVFRFQYFISEAAETRARLTGQFLDILLNVNVVRFFNGINFEIKHLRQAFAGFINKEQRRDRFFLYLNLFQGASFCIFQGICFWLILTGLCNKVLTPGDFILVLTCNIYVVDNFWTLAKDVRDFWEKLGNVRQALKVILAPYSVQDKLEAKPLVVTNGEIEFKDVCFYHVRGPLFFDHQSVHIQAKEKIGLVGFTGSGKSTFINLILRLMDIKQGSIKIDGQNIKQVTLKSLREAISVIPQDIHLFNRTIIENIRYGRLDATDQDVIDAAKKAFIHDFIMQLPQGYQTIAGERGSNLSGGQRQRIVIARAILRNAPIVIIDEATSNLDSITEWQVQKSLNTVMGDRTAIVIAHRLSTLACMDRILVFNKGKIVQEGTHEELLACEDGLYKKLWLSQVDGAILDKMS